MKQETFHMLIAQAYLEGLGSANDAIDTNDPGFQAAGTIGWRVNKANRWADETLRAYAKTLEPNQ